MQGQLLGVERYDCTTTPDGHEELAQRRVGVGEDGELIDCRAFHLPNGGVVGKGARVSLAGKTHDEPLADAPRSPQFRNGAAKHLAPTAQQDDAVGESFHELHLMRAQEHGRTTLTKLLDDPNEEVLVQRVEARERLIEDGEPRAMQDRGRELDLLLVTLRQRLEWFVRPVSELEPLEPLRGRMRGVGAVHASQASEVGERPRGGDVLVESAFLGEISERRRRERRLVRAIYMVGDCPAVRASEAHEHADECRLARAIGAEEGDDLAGTYLERDAVNRPDGTVLLVNIRDREQPVAGS